MHKCKVPQAIKNQMSKEGWKKIKRNVFRISNWDLFNLGIKIKNIHALCTVFICVRAKERERNKWVINLKYYFIFIRQIININES